MDAPPLVKRETRPRKPQGTGTSITKEAIPAKILDLSLFCDLEDFIREFNTGRVCLLYKEDDKNYMELMKLLDEYDVRWRGCQLASEWTPTLNCFVKMDGSMWWQREPSANDAVAYPAAVLQQCVYQGKIADFSDIFSLIDLKRR